MNVQLRPMSQAEFDAYLAKMVPKYAEEGARATGMPPDEAMDFARKQISQLLPDGRSTTGHLFRTVVDGAGESVGVLWCAERLDQDPPDLFIYDICIEEAHRGGGLGSAAMRALEEEAARRNVKAISLHVFTSNEGAVRLYEHLGYVCTYRGDGGQQMTRVL